MDRYLHIRPTEPTNQRQGWLLMNGSLKLVKVINHQCIILDDLTPPRSSSDFGRGRKNYCNCRECTAGQLLRNVNVISSMRPANLNDNRAERTTHLIINSFTIEITSTQTTVTNKSTISCRQRSIYVVRTQTDAGNWLSARIGLQTVIVINLFV